MEPGGGCARRQQRMELGKKGKKKIKKIKITEWSWAGQGPFCKFDRNL
jgi:hypothetical protein